MPKNPYPPEYYNYHQEDDDKNQSQSSQRRDPPPPQRPAPPIYLPPPPPLSSSDEEEEYDEGENPNQRQFETCYEDDYGDVGGGRSRTPVRWGRSTFSPEEMETLEVPLEEDKTEVSKSKCQTLLEWILILTPALCFTFAAHLINHKDITGKDDFKLLCAALAGFQGVMWPSLIFLVVDLIWGKRRTFNKGEEEVTCCGRQWWKLGFMILIHSILSSLSVMTLLLSIQRLNITVALALSFSSTVFVILLTCINREKKFSVEMISFTVLAYVGFVVVGLPAMTRGRGRYAEELTVGVISSIISSACALPATFILQDLRSRRRNILDSLISFFFALIGSIFTILLIFVFLKNQKDPEERGIRVQFGFEDGGDKEPMGWAAGLILLVIFGTVFLFLEGRFTTPQGVQGTRTRNDDDDDQGVCSSNNVGSPNILRMRVLVFISSCSWEIVRQGIWNTVPDPYEVFGSILVFSAFLLSIGYEAWSLQQVQQGSSSRSDTKVNPYPPFHFLSWLFSRGGGGGNTKGIRTSSSSKTSQEIGTTSTSNGRYL